jgi:hypothetical protein
MGFRFRRSIKIAPGVRWNVGLRGSSVSVGGRGATVNFGKRGVRTTVGIPGTGLSYTTSSTGRRSHRSRGSAVDGGPDSSIPKAQSLDPDRFNVSPTPWKVIVGIAAVVLFFVHPGAGAIGLLGFLVVPSRRALAQRELDRRRAEFRGAYNALPLDSVEQMQSLLELKAKLGLTHNDLPYESEILTKGLRRLRLETLQADIASADSASVEALDRLLLSAKELEADQPQVTPIIENLTAAKAVREFEAACGGRLVSLDSARSIVGPDPCYFFASVFLDKHGKDENGTVYFCANGVLFIGISRIEFPWDKVALTRRETKTLIVQRSDRKTAFKFVFDSSGTAAKAEWVSARIRERSGPMNR